ncbi:MAG: carboxy terminal-processing peptidase [Cyclobacteriaceae bacterium]
MRRFIVIVLVWLAGVNVFAGGISDTLKVLEPKPEHAQSLYVALNLLEQYHYRKMPMDDSLSAVMYDNYFSSLDPAKSFFLKADVAYFEKYRELLDNELKASKLDFGFQLFTLYRERALERYNFIPSLLEEEFDFSIEEFYDSDFEKEQWVETREELNEKWRLILKNQAISLKVTGKDWNEIVSILSKRYARVQKAIYQYNSEDVFQSYLNALTTAYDPHTDYFSPITSENFQINMSLSLEGIGARLSQQLDYTVVADVVPGGPAFKSKRLYKDDKIIGVAQGDDGKFEDVIGWRLDDVVQKIRGPKGSIVRLQILKKGDVSVLPDTIRIVREKIKLEDEAAKAEMIPIIEDGITYNLGIITIPSFYINFEERNKGVKDYKSTTRDVKDLIKDLERQGMNGLLIDLRYNGGGSLQEAIDLTGLFIPRGPVVQVRNVDNSVEALYDDDGSETFYEGPLAVLTNRYSASASEIFSGAIQDYRRGIILGENSFGKGTVQNLIDLDRPVVNYLNRLVSYKRSSASNDVEPLVKLRDDIMAGDVSLGQLKMTLAKFYRATGSSTQMIGVRPDILFPTPFNSEEFGESSRPNSLPWDEIKEEPFTRSNTISEEMLDKLYQVYLGHLSEDPQLKSLVEEVNKRKDEMDNTRVSLNLTTRQAEREAATQENDMSTTIEQGDFMFQEVDREKVSKDVYLKEALRLLAELAKEDMG